MCSINFMSVINLFFTCLCFVVHLFYFHFYELEDGFIKNLYTINCSCLILLNFKICFLEVNIYDKTIHFCFNILSIIRVVCFLIDSVIIVDMKCFISYTLLLLSLFYFYLGKFSPKKFRNSFDITSYVLLTLCHITVMKNLYFQ